MEEFNIAGIVKRQEYYKGFFMKKTKCETCNTESKLEEWTYNEKYHRFTCPKCNQQQSELLTMANCREIPEQKEYEKIELIFCPKCGRKIFKTDKQCPICLKWNDKVQDAYDYEMKHRGERKMSFFEALSEILWTPLFRHK